MDSVCIWNVGVYTLIKNGILLIVVLVSINKMASNSVEDLDKAEELAIKRRRVANRKEQGEQPCSIIDATSVKQVVQHEFERKEVNPDATIEITQAVSSTEYNDDKDMLETDINLIKDSIRYNYTTITENLQLEQVLPELYAKCVITVKDKQHIHVQGENKGDIAKCELLIDYLLEKPERSIREFLAVLKTSQSCHYDVIKEIAKKISKGEISVYDNEVAELQDQLIKVYTDKEIHLITSIPGEQFILDLTESKYLMPLNFSTQVKCFDGPDAGIIRKEKRKFQYIPKEYQRIEDILDELDHEKNGVICLGAAGNGKSILASRLVSQWMRKSDNNKLCEKYNLTIYVPLREIDTNASLIEMLGLGTRQLKYFNQEQQGSLKKFLENPNIAKSILLVVDGLDEVDILKSSELYQIIRRTRYPHVNVLCTCRPEADIELGLISSQTQQYIVDLKGTTKKGIHDYLTALLSSMKEGPNQAQVNSVLQRCEEHMFDYNILQTPLYLTFMGYSFIEYWARECSFVNTVIPKSTTDVLNACMRVLLRIWMKRLNKSETTVNSINFARNPTAHGKASTVPNAIKLKLLAMAKLSYNCLMERKYEFDGDDFDKYMIDSDDVMESGLMCTSLKDGKCVFFYKHKVLQEYVAALHLSHVKFNERSFCEILENATKDKTILEIVDKLSVVLQFLCGIDPQFAAEVIRKLQGHVSVSKSKYDNSINIKYESLLVTEAADGEFNQAMIDLLMKSKLKEGDKVHNFKTSLSRIHHFINSLTPDQSATLLKQWYNLQVSKTGEHSNIQACEQVQQKKSNTSTLKLPCCNETLYFLLFAYAPFPGITSLTGNSYVSDVKLLVLLFPNVSLIDIRCNKGISSELGELVFKGIQPSPVLAKQSQLTQVKINTISNLTDNAWTSILEQNDLKSLNLFFKRNFQYSPSTQFKPACNNIQSLTVFVGTMDASQCVVTEAAQTDVTRPTLYKGISLMTWLLQFTPRVTELNLSCWRNETSVQSQSNLIHSIASHLKKLNILRIYSLLSEDLVNEFLHTTVPSLTHLHTLGLGVGDDFPGEFDAKKVPQLESSEGKAVTTTMTVLMETLAAQPAITTVELVYFTEKQNCDKLTRALKNMKQEYPNVRTTFVNKSSAIYF